MTLWFGVTSETTKEIVFHEVPPMLRNAGIRMHPKILEKQLRAYDYDNSGTMDFNGVPCLRPVFGCSAVRCGAVRCIVVWWAVVERCMA